MFGAYCTFSVLTRWYRHDLRTRFIDTMGLVLIVLFISEVRVWEKQIFKQMEDFILQHKLEQLTTLMFSESNKLSKKEKKKPCLSLRLFSDWLVSELCKRALQNLKASSPVHNVEHGRKCEAC